MIELPNTVVFLPKQKQREEYQKMCEDAKWRKNICSIDDYTQIGEYTKPICVEVTNNYRCDNKGYYKKLGWEILDFEQLKYIQKFYKEKQVHGHKRYKIKLKKRILDQFNVISDLVYDCEELYFLAKQKEIQEHTVIKLKNNLRDVMQNLSWADLDVEVEDIEKSST